MHHTMIENMKIIVYYYNLETEKFTDNHLKLLLHRNFEKIKENMEIYDKKNILGDVKEEIKYEQIITLQMLNNFIYNIYIFGSKKQIDIDTDIKIDINTRKNIDDQIEDLKKIKKKY